MRVWSGWGVSLKQRFLQLDLRGKITTALLASTLAIGGLITLSAWLAVHYQLTEQTRTRLKSRIALEQHEIELNLRGSIALTQVLAQNLSSAPNWQNLSLGNSQLAALRVDKRLIVVGADLTVTDLHGRPLAGTLDTLPNFQQSSVLTRLPVHMAPVALLTNEDGLMRVVVAWPVTGRESGQLGGAAILRVPLNALLRPQVEGDFHWIGDRTGEQLAGQRSAGPTFALHSALNLPPPLQTFGLQLVLERDRDMALHAQQSLLLALSIGSLVMMLVVFVLGRIGARFIVNSLGEIASAAEDIAQSGRPAARLPVRSTDEFGRLSAAFNTMIERLRQSYVELEDRVAERTFEYEHTRRTAEQATNLLNEAVQNIAVGFSIFDRNDRLVMCNEAYRDFYPKMLDLCVPGVSFTEILQCGVERGVVQDIGIDRTAWVTRRGLHHQEADGMPLEYQLSDGRWLLIIERRTPSGYTVGNHIDITALQNATDALRVRETYLRATIDNVPFFFWLKDTHSRFLAVNQVFAEACGKGAPDEVVGLTDYDVWPQELAEIYRADDFAVMASRHEKMLEEPVAGGSETGWIETYKKPVIAADGSLLGTVGFARDISERRFAEARIRDRNEQLNAIFSLSPDGFVSFDAKFRVKYANPAFLRMTGFEESRISGLSEDDFSKLLTDACTAHARFPGMASLRQACPDPSASEVGGRRILIELAGPGKRVLEVGMRISDAETVSQILYFCDVTHETEVDRLKSEFLSTAAHELRTPMASIYGFSELMLNHEFSDEEKTEFLGAIYRQSELMVSIINELLDLARIEARRGKDFNYAVHDLCEVVRELLSNFKVPAGRQVPLLRSFDTASPIRADRNKLIQAIGNVVSNAYKYSPAGGAVELSLVRQTSQPDALAWVGIQVRDHGIGMTAEQQARVCERFYRADSSGKIPGTGLGMSIVEEIVNLHNGRLLIESQPGAGTAVTLLFPDETLTTGCPAC